MTDKRKKDFWREQKCRGAGRATSCSVYSDTETNWMMTLTRGYLAADSAEPSEADPHVSRRHSLEGAAKNSPGSEELSCRFPPFLAQSFRDHHDRGSDLLTRALRPAPEAASNANPRGSRDISASRFPRKCRKRPAKWFTLSETQPSPFRTSPRDLTSGSRCTQ